MARSWRAWALGLAAGALALHTALPAIARHYVFPAHRVPAVRAPDDVTTHALVAKDGVAVHAIEIPAPANAPTVVYFHNNRQTVEACVGLARAIRERGLGVLLVEYRGYGASSASATPSEEGLYRDAEAALDMLAARGTRSDRVVLWGTSLGTGVAAEMARRGRGAALVLVTPYTSIPDLVTNAAPIVPARALLPDHFDTLGKASEIRVPTVVVHGDADEVVPFWMGERVSRAIAGSRWVPVAGARHHDVLDRERAAQIADLVRGG